MLASLSLAGWSFIVGAVGVAVGLLGYLTNWSAIRSERKDRQQDRDDAWAREWAAQRPIVFPRVPSDPGSEMLTFKNAGRGPALNVEGEVVIRRKDGGDPEHWSDFAAGTIAVDDEETALFSPAVAPAWTRLSGTIRYTDLVGGAYVTHFDFSGGGGTTRDLRVVVHPQETETAPQPPEPD